jgi:superfamily I DNA/RNA helicase
VTPDEALRGAGRAIEIERAHAGRGVPVRVRGAARVDVGVIEVAVDCDQPLDPGGWTGGDLVRQLTDGGAAFRASVLEVDADRDRLYVELKPGDDLPEPGPARVFPFDFLSAAHRVLHDAAFEGVRGALGDALVGTLGQELALELDGPPGLAPAWGHDRVWVWGPPGTGKTYTLVQEVATLLRDPTERVLVVSTTNRATDEIALRLGARLRGEGRLREVVRLGRVSRTDEYRREELLGIVPALDPDLADRLAALTGALSAARSAEERAGLRQALRDEAAVVPSLGSRLLADRCVVTTMHAAMRAVVNEECADLLREGRPPFTTLVIDEAGLVGRMQAAMVSLLASRRVVLVGDPRQLSPIAQASRSMPPEVRRWIARSALDHLGDDVASPAVQRLTVQHRMHSEIRAAVSAFAYGGALSDALGVDARPWGDFALRRLPRAAWYVLDEHTERKPPLHSERGPGGASRQRELALSVIRALVLAHEPLRTSDVLFVTPYRAQVNLVRDALAELGCPRWRVSTIHAQQGGEADVVLFDTVHASSTTWPADEWVRLVNVALSRARQMVLVLASRVEMDQPFLRALRRHLTPRVLRRGVWETVGADDAGATSLFTAAPVAASPALPGWQPADDDRLGAQLARRKALRPVMSQEQALLAHRELSDAGPRLVRGVAGSGKTLVLAHWVVRALDGLGVPEVVIVYANKALRSLLESVVEGAWSTLHPVPGPVPWHRVHLRFIGELLADLAREAGLASADDTQRYDFEWQANRLLDSGPPAPRFVATFVDEAQDLGHDTLRLLIALTQVNSVGARPVLVFYDNAQNVYGRPPPRWKALGLDLRGRSDVMKESFRSTRPNTELALDVLDQLRPVEKDPDLRELVSAQPPLLWRDEVGWQAGFCAVEGQAPAVRLYDDRESELRMVVAQVKAWIHRDGVRPGDIRLLAIKNTREMLVGRLRAALGGVRVEARTTEGFADCDDAVVVSTPHSYKGHDAELVVVVGLDDFYTKGEPLVAPIYVALTRARTLLVVTATRAASGPAKRIVAALEAAKQRWEGAARGG